MTERDLLTRLIGVLEAIATTNAPLNVSAAQWVASVQKLADKEAAVARRRLEEMGETR